MNEHPVPWLSLLALGAVHGLNPAMGWLFAVGRALQTRDRRALWSAFGPLVAGHLAAVAVAVLVAVALGQALPPRWLRWIVAGSLLAVGVDGLRRHRHVRLSGMRVSGRELATWSFLMASAHGAGLMVLPFVLGGTAPAPSGHHHGAVLAAGIETGRAVAFGAPLVHTAGYLIVTITLAVVVYEKVGLRMLRRAWINVDLLWSAALIAAAGAAVLV